MKKYFGTDGIRGIANTELTTGIAKRCANALTFISKNPTVVVGRDTRLSGDMLFSSIASGITCGGGNVIDLGIVSTPAVAYLTTQLKADYGIMISASHNPPEFNGIKIFADKGYKIPEDKKNIIEDRISQDLLHNCNPMEIGRVEKIDTAVDRYVQYLVKNGVSLKGEKIVLDCSNGAVFLIAPRVFTSLGADVVAVNLESDGINVNHGCGALYPEVCARLVKENGASYGFCFDGDADRIMAIDDKGNIVDGDGIIYVLAKYLKSKSILEKNTVVGTLHTNMGTEKKLAENGINLVRTDVGDQHVLEEMIENGYSLGGEQSGHVIYSKLSTTGDGVLTAVLLSKLIKEDNVKLSSLVDFTPYPQENVGVVVKDKEYVLGHIELQDALSNVKNELRGKGRVLLRASGTEPKIRVMVECENAKLAKKYIELLGNIVKKLSVESD